SMKRRGLSFQSGLFVGFTSVALAACGGGGGNQPPSGSGGINTSRNGGRGGSGAGGGGGVNGTGGNAGGGGSAGGGAQASGGSTGSGGATGTGGGGGMAGTGGTTMPPRDGGSDAVSNDSAPPADTGNPNPPFSIPTVTWPSMACQTRVSQLMAMMTRPEKAAQMVMAPTTMATPADTQAAAPGAVFAPGGEVAGSGNTAAGWAAKVDAYTQAATRTRLQIPILFGADAVHGHNLAAGTVIFPHNIGLGSTRNPALVQEVARITALEVAATGINWTFAPVVSVSWDDRWGRVYESFSEDPKLTAQLAAASTMGLQGPMGLGTGKPGIVGCSKHWAGDGQATAGTSAKGGIVDRGDIRINDTLMRQFGIAPYLDAIKAGLGSVMVSAARWNGASLTSHRRIMTDILKTEIGFKGFISTDWNAATDSGGGIPATINAGVDMLMQPADWRGAINTIANSASIPDARINDAVTRILHTKCEAGLFDWKRDPAALAQVGSAAHREVGRRAVRESMVLLQNNNAALPIAKTARVWVGGSGANNLTNQCGGWTIAWQGSGSMTQGTTISQAISRVAMVTPTLAQADVAVVVLSEKAYAEFLGDSASIDTLPQGDFALLQQAKQAGKKVVAIVISGRPVLITNHVMNADAWIAAWLPGTEGTGVADVLFGDYAPTGKLSHSWPRTQNQANVNFGDPGYNPLFPLGHGLTYGQ
ncbi:MAG TPA: glycoside hydrolase family 3 N-terminal domain-containing protein, partial [Polyangia bacterium]